MPLANFGQQQLGVALVADEVVVDQEDRTAPTQVVEVLQLGNELLGSLGAWFAAVEHDDVAELAIEWAAPGELHAHRVVGIELKQIEAGNRRCRHIGLFAFRGEASAALAALDGFDEHRQGDFTLIEHLEISQVQLRCIGSGAGEGAANGHRQTTLFGVGNLHGHVVLLDDHSGNDHQLSPVPLGFGDLTHIAVHQLHLPLLGQQGRHGDHAKGRQQHLAVHQLQDLLVAPEGLGEFGVDEQGAHAR